MDRAYQVTLDYDEPDADQKAVEGFFTAGDVHTATPAQVRAVIARINTMLVAEQPSTLEVRWRLGELLRDQGAACFWCGFGQCERHDCCNHA